MMAEVAVKLPQPQVITIEKVKSKLSTLGLPSWKNAISLHYICPLTGHCWTHTSTELRKWAKVALAAVKLGMALLQVSLGDVASGGGEAIDAVAKFCNAVKDNINAQDIPSLLVAGSDFTEARGHSLL
jgi:hypothetical protein